MGDVGLVHQLLAMPIPPIRLRIHRMELDEATSSTSKSLDPIRQMSIGKVRDPAARITD